MSELKSETKDEVRSKETKLDEEQNDQLNFDTDEELHHPPSARSYIWGWGRLPTSVPSQNLNSKPLLFPKLVEALEIDSLRNISVGSRHICAVANSGNVYGCGPGLLGETDEVPTSTQSSPLKQVGESEKKENDLDRNISSSRTLRKICTIGDHAISSTACGTNQLYAVSSKGKVLQWKIDDFNNRVAVFPFNRQASMTEKASNDNTLFDENIAKPSILIFPENIRISRMSCGSGFVIAVSEDGGVYSWGNGNHGKLGHGNDQSCVQPKRIKNLEEPISFAACGWSHTIAVSYSGKVFSWGCSLNGRLGFDLEKLGAFSDDLNCQYSHRTRNSSDSKRYFDVGVPQIVKLNESEELDPVIDASCGYGHNIIICASGAVYVWGLNNKGQLGVGDLEDAYIPIKISMFDPIYDYGAVKCKCGPFHTGVLTSGGDVLTWGWGKHGQLGHGDRNDRLVPQQVVSLAGLDVVQLSCGGECMLAVTSNFMIVKNNYFYQNAEKSGSDSMLSTKYYSELGSGTDLSNRTSELEFKSFSTKGPHGFVPLPKVIRDRGSLSETLESSSKSKKVLPKLQPAHIRNSPLFSATNVENDFVKIDFGSGAVSPPLVSVSEDQHINTQPVRKKHTILNFMYTKLNSLLSSSSKKQPHLNSKFDFNIGANPIALHSKNFRPDNLPPKTHTEASKHIKEVNRVNKKYRDKLIREAKEKALRRQKDQSKLEEQNKKREEQEKLRLQREAQLGNASQEWLKNIVPFWNSKKIYNKKKNLIWKIGIPPQIRKQVWPLAIGNNLMITKELYSIFLEKAREARRNRSNGIKNDDEEKMGCQNLSKETTFFYIDIDLTRTFPQLAFFQEECSMHQDLKDILEAFCFYRPDIGYVQGMSYLAAFLLLYLDHFQAFVCFANLLNSPFFHVFLKLDPIHMEKRYDLFNKLFKEHLPKLFLHFDEIKLMPGMYFMEWCMTLFCKRLSLDVAARVWDCYLMFDEGVIYRTGVAILKVLNDKLLDKPIEICMKIFQSQLQNISENELFEAISSIKLSSSIKEEIENLTVLT